MIIVHCSIKKPTRMSLALIQNMKAEYRITSRLFNNEEYKMGISEKYVHVIVKVAIAKLLNFGQG